MILTHAKSRRCYGAIPRKPIAKVKICDQAHSCVLLGQACGRTDWNSRKGRQRERRLTTRFGLFSASCRATLTCGSDWQVALHPNCLWAYSWRKGTKDSTLRLRRWRSLLTEESALSWISITVHRSKDRPDAFASHRHSTNSSRRTYLTLKGLRTAGSVFLDATICDKNRLLG